MTIRKTVTEKVLSANKKNASKSPGPSSEAAKNAVRYNALKHGLLAKGIVFKNAEEKLEFERMIDELEEQLKPSGVLQRMVVEEIGVCWWKLQIAQGWELQEIRNRRNASNSVIRTLVEQSAETEFPLFQQDDGTSATIGLSWDCNELLVRSSNRENRKEELTTLGHRDERAGRVELEAKLTSSLETILRYEVGIKRDLYKAIHTLRELQRTRRKSRTRDR